MRIVLADDHILVRDGLNSLLEKELDFEVIGLADNGRDAVQLAVELRPEIIIMDLSMPELNGIEATRKISKITKTRTIILSMYSERRFLLESLHAGAYGYVLKDDAIEELAVAIRRVDAGDYFISAKFPPSLLQDFMKKIYPPSESAFALLTPREREVLQLIAEGKGTKEIAFTFGVSPKTVETQRMNITRKLNINNVAELTKYAIREGLTTI